MWRIRSGNSGRFFNRWVQVVIYKVGMRLGRPLTAIHYSLPPLPVIIFPYSQPTSTLSPLPPPHIPPHHRALCIPGLSIQPTILANINAVRLWILYTPRRLSLLPRHPFFDVLHNPGDGLCVYGTVVGASSNSAFEIIASSEVYWMWTSIDLKDVGKC